MSDLLTIDGRVRKVIEEHLGIIGFAWEAHLVRDLGGDSLDVIELQVALEEELGVNIADDQVDNWQTAGDILKTVEALR